MSEALISLSQVSKHYQVGEVRIEALNNVDLQIDRGEFVVILGPSGSGKTTLLNLIGGLDNVSQGRVVIDGEETTRMTESQLTEFRKQHVGFVFQFFNLIPTLTAYENVAISSELACQQALTAEEVLGAVGLSDRADHFPNQLSGGEQQRVAVARALVKNTPLVLCDEPTGELDYETGIRILKLLVDVNQRYEKTFIVVTHNAAIGQIADRVIKLRSGAIVSDERNAEPLDPAQLTW